MRTPRPGGATVRRACTARAAVCLLPLLITGCRTQPLQTTTNAATPKPQAAFAATASGDSTEAIAAELQSVARAIKPDEMVLIINAERAQHLKQMLDKADPTLRESLRLDYATELLNAGKTQQALDEFAGIERTMKSAQPSQWEESKNDIRLLQATGYMRLGEQQNCCSVNMSDSCLLPIRGAGVHIRQAGSTRAMQIFEEILADRPDDVKARWLLNIAAMTLGKYPAGVPGRWLIAPKFFRSEYDVKRFPNIAGQVGLNLLALSGGAVVDDLDGDGNLDVMVSSIGFQDQLRFFHNNGNATFTERTDAAKLTGETGGLNLLQADYNNDGHTDVLVLRGGWMGVAGRFPMSLLRNNGDGTFTDVTRQAGLLNYGPTQTAVWLDHNNDGRLDLFVGYESGPSNTHPCALYRNNGDGTFTNVAEQAGVNHVGFIKGVVSADYDNDGWPDLFLSGGGAKVLYHNNGNGTFTNVTEKAGISSPILSFGAFFFDYDNDGWADLFVMDYDVRDNTNVMRDIQGLPVSCDTSHLYHNNRNGTFTDVTKPMRLNKVMMGMGLNFGDLDNDGYLDFYAGTGNPDLTTLIPNRMFRNAGGKFF